MSKCDFNKVAKQGKAPLLNAHLGNTFSVEYLGMAASEKSYIPKYTHLELSLQSRT